MPMYYSLYGQDCFKDFKFNHWLLRTHFHTINIGNTLEEVISITKKDVKLYKIHSCITVKVSADKAQKIAHPHPGGGGTL